MELDYEVFIENVYFKLDLNLPVKKKMFDWTLAKYPESFEVVGKGELWKKVLRFWSCYRMCLKDEIITKNYR